MAMARSRRSPRLGHKATRAATNRVTWISTETDSGMTASRMEGRSWSAPKIRK